jgi:predicted O-linked N-acetylglucosamine transferase (SPINDLY family)
MIINKAIQLAFEHYGTGDLKQAESLCRDILEKQPNSFGILHLLGIIYYQVGDFDSATHYIKEALRFNPQYSEAYNNLGSITKAKGQLDEAINYFQKAIDINPYYVDAYYNLGNAFINKEQLDDAITCYQKAIDLNPHFALAYNNLGNIFIDKGQLDQAITYYKKALAANPHVAVTYNNLGNALSGNEQFAEAITCYQKALNLNPSDVKTYLNLGNAMKKQGKMNEAVAAYDRALEYKPSYIEAIWARCMAQLPVVYPNQPSIQIARRSYYEGLVKLWEIIFSKPPQDIEEDPSVVVGKHKPFYLAYQGLNDRELQKIYGELVCRIMAFKYPQFAVPPSMPSWLPGEPLRIGIASGYFYYHSNWKIPIKGWVENLDKQKFDLYGYYTWNKKDQETIIARQCFKKFIEGVHPFEKLCQIIRDDNLHVLIFPEVGMDPLTVRLASLKLAPIQCTSWGHPDTSGLPVIDYYLSSNLMEPSDAENHYTEKLIRLPNLSIYYAPNDLPHVYVNRETFGLRPNAILYLCCQSLFKYLPQYDEVYPKIAQEMSDCQFIFISNKSNFVTEQFRSRIKLTFNKYGLDAEDYVIFLPFLEPAQYHAINRLSDIYLDSIGWSGCNSTFEAISHNLPIVTLLSELMRGRHSFAILSMMGMKDTVARSLDEYVEIAVRLGLNSGWRNQISNNIEMNKHRVYRDETCITALEDFLETVVKEKLE